MNKLAIETDPRAGFLEYYEETAPVVFAYLIRACGGERQLAEDLTQETFSAALTAWKTGNTDDKNVPWIITVARNKMIDRFRKHDRESRGLARLPRPRRGDDDVARRVVDNHAVLACLRRLPPLQRAVVALRFVDDMSIAEVAALLGKHKGAIDSLQRRALANLRTMMEENDHGN